jgi:hypothetical protein
VLDLDTSFFLIPRYLLSSATLSSSTPTRRNTFSLPRRCIKQGQTIESQTVSVGNRAPKQAEPTQQHPGPKPRNPITMRGENSGSSVSQPASPRSSRRPNPLSRNHSSTLGVGEADERSPLLLSSKSRLRIQGGVSPKGQASLSRHQSNSGMPDYDRRVLKDTRPSIIWLAKRSTLVNHYT